MLRKFGARSPNTAGRGAMRGRKGGAPPRSIFSTGRLEPLRRPPEKRRLIARAEAASPLRRCRFRSRCHGWVRSAGDAPPRRAGSRIRRRNLSMSWIFADPEPLPMRVLMPPPARARKQHDDEQNDGQHNRRAGVEAGYWECRSWPDRLMPNLIWAKFSRVAPRS